MPTLRGDTDTLIAEYAKDFSISRAMDAAGYRGVGRIYEAVRDIEEHAHILRRYICGGAETDTDERRQRILREYERIAFAAEDEGIRISDKLRALDMYRALSYPDEDTGQSGVLVVNYDYGDSEG